MLEGIERAPQGQLRIVADATFLGKVLTQVSALRFILFWSKASGSHLANNYFGLAIRAILAVSNIISTDLKVAYIYLHILSFDRTEQNRI